MKQFYIHRNAEKDVDKDYYMGLENFLKWCSEAGDWFIHIDSP